MIVALSMRAATDAAHGELRDALSHDWIRLLEGLDVTPLLVPNGLYDPARLIEAGTACGIILTSGNDVGCVPGERWAGSESVSAARDQTETALLRHALTRRMPVLGVCRGMQLINTFFGGTLCRDVGQASGGERHAGSPHPVRIADRAYRQRFGLQAGSVNSFHDHGVAKPDVAPGLTVLADSPGGIVEGLAHPDLPIIGIQWHPERPEPTPRIGREVLRLWLTWCAGYAKAGSAAALVEPHGLVRGTVSPHAPRGANIPPSSWCSTTAGAPRAYSGPQSGVEPHGHARGPCAHAPRPEAMWRPGARLAWGDCGVASCPAW